MGGLTFDEVMKFYPGHNLETYRDILKAQKSGGLLPFVGAGLSVFCGYKLWGGVLWELAEYIFDVKQKQAVFDKIKAGAYGEAAQLLLEYYPPMLNRLPRLISPNIIEPIQHLKVEHLGNRNPLLHTDELLIALSVCAVTNPVVEEAINALGELRGCEAHSSVILSHQDEELFKRLGMNITLEPHYQTEKLFHA